MSSERSDSGKPNPDRFDPTLGRLAALRYAREGNLRDAIICYIGCDLMEESDPPLEWVRQSAGRLKESLVSEQIECPEFELILKNILAELE